MKRTNIGPPRPSKRIMASKRSNMMSASTKTSFAYQDSTSELYTGILYFRNLQEIQLNGGFAAEDGNQNGDLALGLVDA